MVTCKSPLKVIRAAHQLGRQLFLEHAHKFSRKDYTLPQLFACLVLREHQKESYRGTEALLLDSSDLRNEIGLRSVPDHNTLCRAFKYLIKPAKMNLALDVTVDQAMQMGLNVRGDSIKPTTLDSTCFESRHVSRHFEKRQRQTAGRSRRADANKTPVKPGKTAGDRRRSRTVRRLPKLSLAVASACHLILAARATTGMGADHPHFQPLLSEACRRAHVHVVVADAGYDSEQNHLIARLKMGVRSMIPPNNGRPTDKPPTTRYRRLMHKQFKHKTHKSTYGQRWQVETVNSMIKRNLGSALRARTARRRSMELLLRCVTHNIMVLEGTEP